MKATRPPAAIRRVVVCLATATIAVGLPTRPQVEAAPRAEGDVADLPVDADGLLTMPEVEASKVRNLVALHDLRTAIADGVDGLSLDLGHVRTLLDGTEIDPHIIQIVTHNSTYFLLLNNNSPQGKQAVKRVFTYAL